MIGGGIWSLFRFALVALLVLRLVPADPLFHLNLLWVGAPALLLTGVFAANAFVAGGNRYYLPLLRIGTVLAALTDAIVVLTGSYVPSAERVADSAGPLARLIFIIVYGILAVDLLIFAALISYRPMDGNTSDHRDTRRDDESTHAESE
jgi:hypothetical protein